MRILTLLPLVLLTGACWTPGPGQVDPTRYPWDPRNRAALVTPPAHPRIVARGAITPSTEWQTAPQPQPTPDGSYCIMAIEQESQTGISLSANSNVLACTAPSNYTFTAEPASPPK